MRRAVASLVDVLTTGVELVADDLRRYGEVDAARWIVDCSAEELVRVCCVADWLLYNGPRLPSGASMLIAKACAIAAVYVREGRPRKLALSRRGPATGVQLPPTGGRRPDHRLHESVPADCGVGQDFRQFWHAAGLGEPSRWPDGSWWTSGGRVHC